jgi:hypothetical protein
MLAQDLNTNVTALQAEIARLVAENDKLQKIADWVMPRGTKLMIANKGNRALQTLFTKHIDNVCFDEPYMSQDAEYYSDMMEIIKAGPKNEHYDTYTCEILDIVKYVNWEGKKGTVQRSGKSGDLWFVPMTAKDTETLFLYLEDK